MTHPLSILLSAAVDNGKGERPIVDFSAQLDAYGLPWSDIPLGWLPDIAGGSWRAATHRGANLMHDVYLLLYLLAVVFFGIAAFDGPRRVTFIALGLLAAFLVPLIVTIRTG